MRIVLSASVLVADDAIVAVSVDVLWSVFTVADLWHVADAVSVVGGRYVRS